jgi:ABC-type nickel/cobalt efflux system permease component RcnA
MTLADRIIAWILSTFGAAMALLFLVRSWTTTKWDTKVSIVLLGIFAFWFAWQVVKDSAKLSRFRDSCPHCGRKL